MAISEKDVVDRYRSIYEKSMRNVPICNSALEVEAVAFHAFEKHLLGVLITPWFMNLLLLPGDETWRNSNAGTIEELLLPSAPCEFTICQDEILGTFLSAILFRSMAGFPNQHTAIAVAKEALSQLMQPPAKPLRQSRDKRQMSRRQLFSGLGGF